MTWAGHCMVTVSAALRDLPTAEARLGLLRDIEHFCSRKADEIDRGLRRRRNPAPSKASRAR